ncbi:tetratricopeptide repeat protein [Ruegeria meonggei]|uniref:tetratricopeptide repeat protein n=1 Tax=Ruegeria meonggei TaxID=1446476 RepID=UPI003672CE12
MHIRLAALIIVIVTLILSFNSPSKSGPDYTQMAEACLGNKGGMSHVVAACTTLMEGEGVSLENQSRLLRARGWAYYCGKQYKDAISDYEKALDLRPGDTISRLRRAKALDAHGNPDAAKDDYAKTLLMDPTNTTALLGMSRIDEKQGNLAEAILGYKRVLEIEPSSEGSGYAVAYLINKIDGKEGVKQFLDHASTRWPEQPWAYELLVEYHLSYTGNHLEALEAISEIACLTSDIETVLALRARVHLGIGDEKKGIDYVKKLAAHQYANDDTKKGFFIRRWFNAAIKWYLWRDKEELFFRGYLFAIFNRPDLAAQDYENALQALGYRGRKEILDIFVRDGVSVSQQAYAGSAEHLEKVISDYVVQSGKRLERLRFQPVNAAPHDLKEN